MKYLLLQLIVFIAFLSCGKSSTDDNNVDEFNLLESGECYDLIDSLEIFIIQQTPVKILNFTQLEFEQEVTDAVLESVDETSNLDIRLAIYYPLQSDNCLGHLYATDDLKGSFFYAMQDLFDGKIKYSPGEQVDIPVIARGRTLVMVRNGIVDSIEHTNYEF